jgi:hypothetical protein
MKPLGFKRLKTCEIQTRRFGQRIHHQKRVRAFYNTDCHSRFHTLMTSVMAKDKFQGMCLYCSQSALQYNTVPCGVMRKRSKNDTTVITADLRVKAQYLPVKIFHQLPFELAESRL